MISERTGKLTEFSNQAGWMNNERSHTGVGWKPLTGRGVGSTDPRSVYIFFSFHLPCPNQTAIASASATWAMPIPTQMPTGPHPNR